MDVAAKVICESGQGNILNQYITFSRIFDEQQILYPGDREKIVMETIRICKDKKVLNDYPCKRGGGCDYVYYCGSGRGHEGGSGDGKS